MVTFHTNHGDIVIKTFDDKAPETVKNFLDYCREGFYNNTIFHRVINGFMIQGGGFEPGMNQKATKEAIKNEANNGPTTLAYQCMKEVRERAGLNELPDMTQEEFRQTVKDERAMELCFEYTRRFDLIRWGEYVKNMRALVTEAQSGNNWTQGPTNVYTYFNISSTYNYFPIPDAEMSVNKDITQNNPGW